MNRNDFIKIIQDTGSIDRHMVGEIREVLDMFPYFQSAHLLLLKGLFNNSDIKFESQLKESALHTADREILYHLLEKEKQPDKVEPEISKPVINEPDTAVDNMQTVIESGKNSQEIIEEIEKDNSVEDDSGQNEYSPQGLPRSLLVTEESSQDESVNMVFLLDDDEEKPEERIFYMDPAIIVPDKDDLLELDLSEDAIYDSEGLQTEPDVVKDDAKPAKRQEQADLIDRFIISNPRIEPVKEKTENPVEDKSKPFIEEKEGFITETLAKIYINQGYYSKAIDIYEKLSLKFPEKSSYFATQIGKIKELIKY